MNILFVGLGSIGQRHLRNLNKLKIKFKFFAVRKKFFTPLLTNKNKAIKGDIQKKYNIVYLKSLNEIKQKKIKIDAAFICSPSKFHIDETIWLIKNNINVFVEKPLGSSLKNINKLIKLIKKKPNIKNMMGYQLKFNPIIIKMRELIKKNSIGTIHNIFIHHGEHIDDFHPYEDYKSSYAARKELGGGVILSQIHEIDYMMYLFDNRKIKILNSLNSKISNLILNVEDYVVANFKLYNKKFKSICTMYLNFFEKPKNRKILIIGEKGKINCDLNKGYIKVFKSNKFKQFKFKFDRNKIFIKQVKYFIQHVRKNKKIDKKYDVLNGIRSLKIALNLKN